jgi:amphi-Trp domain-containing protein
MMADLEKFEYESIQDKQSIRKFFDTLIEGIEKGRIILSAENDQTVLTPAELIRFVIKTKKKTGKSKITIKLSWKDSVVENYRKKGNEIHISS